MNFSKILNQKQINNQNYSHKIRRKVFSSNTFCSNDIKNSEDIVFNKNNEKEHNLKLLKFLNKQPNLNAILKDFNNHNNIYFREISDLDNFKNSHMIETIKRQKILTKDIKYKKEEEEKSKKSDEYYCIKRNKLENTFLDDLNVKNLSDDSSLPSLTEANLDKLYKESYLIQKRIMKKKNDGVGKRLKQFLKLEEISK